MNLDNLPLVPQLRRLQPRAEGWGIGGARILLGLMWLANLHWKVPGDFGKDNGGGLYKYVAAGAENAPLAPYRWVTRELILPNYVAFGWFTLLSETVIALLLIIGWRTRLTALAGAALSVPIMLSVLYYPRADEWSWSYLMMIGFHVLLAAMPNAGLHLGVDGVLRRTADRARSSLRALGVTALVIGLAGLWVARSADFAGEGVKLLGSDNGFLRDDKLVRRWELKFVWFNPLWAILTMVCAVLLIVGARRVQAAWAGVAGFGVLALVALFQATYDYVRDDGAVQKIATGSNVAIWGGFALAGWLIARRSRSA